MVFLHFGFWTLEAKKSPKEPQEALMRAINSAFWMELNITLKILAFCIPSFQSSWHFAFCIFPLRKITKQQDYYNITLRSPVWNRLMISL